jgi:ABC-type sugar transport system substrate-binding protein
MFKKVIVLLMAAAMTVSMVACGSSTTKTTSSGAKKQIVIGLTMAGMDSAYLKPVSTYAQKEAAAKGAKLILTDAQWDAQKQADQINSFIAQKVDAIIINPVDASSMLPSLKKIKAAGIPCIDLNMKVDDVSSDYINTYVGASMQAEAQMAADMTDKALDSKGGNVVIIEGAPGSDAQIYRTKSYEDQITSKYPNIKILGIENGAWDRSKAMAAAQDLLTKYPNIDVIYCHDDNMSIGAIQAAKAAGRFAKIKFVGIGGSIDGINAITAGDMYGSVTQPPDFEGSSSVDAAIDAASGKTLKAWIRDPVQMILKDNVSQFKGLW